MSSSQSTRRSRARRARTSLGPGIRLQAHAQHRARTTRGKLSGLLVNPPNGALSRMVYVYDDQDWELVHLNTDFVVTCPEPGCGVRLFAKRSSRGNRFFAAQKGSTCRHHDVDILAAADAMARPPGSGTGGGPEGPEHKWIKEQIAQIARSLDQEAIVEHVPTHGDVYLPGSGWVLEYQRWDTDFHLRTEQRKDNGASSTLWLLPERQPELRGTLLDQKTKDFNHQVFHKGDMYLSVRDPMAHDAHLEPWIRPDEADRADLYVSGSVVAYNASLGYLVRRRTQFRQVLYEILAGTRTFEAVTVYTKETARAERAQVWVRGDDLAKARAAETARRQKQASPVAPSTTGQAAPPARGEDEPREHAQEHGESTPAHPLTDSQSRAQAAPLHGRPAQNPWLTPLSPENPQPEPGQASPAVASPEPCTVQPPTQVPRPSIWSRLKTWLRHGPR